MDDGSYQIILLVVFILLSMFFSSSETALTTLSPIRLRSMIGENVKGAKMVSKITEDPKKLLTTILIGNNIVNIGASALATSIAISKAPDNSYIVGIVTGVLTFIILVFGEITPKTIAAQNCEKISLIVAPFIYIFVCIFTPVAYILNLISGLFIKLLGGDPNKKPSLVTELELKTMVNVGQEEGVLEEDEQKMIHNVFEFGDSTAQDIMTPRTDMVAIPYESTFEELIQVFNKEKFSRIPVYKESIDDIVGILYIKDFIFHDNKNFSIDTYLREAFFTYESKSVKELFEEMRNERMNMSIVVDEYGGTEGLVTLEDLVEEIVGEILDENDEEEDFIEEVNDNEYIVSGGTKLDDLNENLNMDLHSEDFDTIAGYVIGIFGKIPDEEDFVDDMHYTFHVLNVDKNRIEKLRIIRKEVVEETTEEFDVD